MVIFTCACALAFLSAPYKQLSSVDKWYLARLDSLRKDLVRFQRSCSSHLPVAELKTCFLKSRRSYKQLAVLTEYFNPLESKILNGPAIPRSEDDNPFTIIPPHGFQHMEELLFSKWEPQKLNRISQEINVLLPLLDRLENETDRSLKFKPEYVWEALRFSAIRLIALGITGYDSPIAEFSVQEAEETLKGMDAIIRLMVEENGEAAHKPCESILQLTTKARSFLSGSTSFESFDRLRFIKLYADPLYGELAHFAESMNIPEPAGKRLVNPKARSLFAKNAFSIQFFTPDEQYKLTPERIALGKKLFYDPLLSATKKRSCASCHQPERAFTDGLAVPVDMDGKTPLLRNTPTLINSVFQAKQFYDSRTNLLENQLDEVVHNTREMNGSLKRSAAQLKDIPAYKNLFDIAYRGEKEPVSGYNIANAISSYVRSLTAMNARFDRYMNGEPAALNTAEKKGFNLFTGKAKCATCHFIPFFNGSVPPDYTESESEVLGVPQAGKGKAKLDPDKGKEGFTQSPVHAYAFKTPTLRNTSLTAPYMHNGVFKTLEQVLDFYDQGGGYGLGIAPATTTLPPGKLHLTALEKKQIIAFLKCLNDTVTVVHYDD
ncbi:MAG TPA: cytochrome c peroxidase [Flavisolibacter sp.]|jgi:cytochrome c peroxidase|nr:cytochrome c peroxidase [Flavisolibacter sp.]